MALATSPSRSIPDFSFPPKSRYAVLPQALLNATVETKTTQRHRSPPKFGFPVHQNSVLVTKPSSPTSTSSIPESSQSSLFLTIPLEIRLQIYSYMLLSHPIYHAHLAPLKAPTSSEGMNTEEFHTVMLRPLALSMPRSAATISNSDSDSNSKTTGSRTEIHHTIISPSSSLNSDITETRLQTPSASNQVRGKIPTALLASCKQVFEETKLLPWEKNTFSFVNWFWSGIYAARQFTRDLKPWQANGIRNTSVEVLGRDLWIGESGEIGSSTGGVGGKEGKGVGEWCGLCELWGGIWNLRLVVKGSVFAEGKTATGRMLNASGTGFVGADGTNGLTDTVVDETHNATEAKTTILDVNRQWIQHGLLRMGSLRKMEIEIEDDDVAHDTRARFCAELGAALQGKVQITLVEKIKFEAEEEKAVVPNRDFVWYGGEPGDDSIWGLEL